MHHTCPSAWLEADQNKTNCLALLNSFKVMKYKALENRDYCQCCQPNRVTSIGTLISGQIDIIRDLLEFILETFPHCHALMFLMEVLGCRPVLRMMEFSCE